ncbi:hypothetical protein B0J17DRAFT_664049 [Rhizoctonia solani]|nr:hypothetical protein B0J17DRAFT_664049 [Rhizoctonia solani]
MRSNLTFSNIIPYFAVRNSHSHSRKCFHTWCLLVYIRSAPTRSWLGVQSLDCLDSVAAVLRPTQTGHTYKTYGNQTQVGFPSFSSSLHTNMTSQPTIITGYKLRDNLAEHYNHPVPPLRRLVRSLQQALHIPVVLVEVEDDDDDEDNTIYVCCYVNDAVFDAEGGVGMDIPPTFERVKEVLKTEGEVKRRMFCMRGPVYAAEPTWN